MTEPNILDIDPQALTDDDLGIALRKASKVWMDLANEATGRGLIVTPELNNSSMLSSACYAGIRTIFTFRTMLTKIIGVS